MTGIYQIRNIKNGKRYYGKSFDVEGKRWVEHRHDLGNGSHHCSHLQNAWKKYGEENFVWEIVEECQIGFLLEREQFWLDTVRLRDENGVLGQIDRELSYNIAATSSAAMTGRKHSEETKKKMSLSQKGHPTSEESKRKNSEAHLGMKLSEESRKKLSESLMGHEVSPATREKISASLSGEKHFAAKLTWEKVREIREKYAVGNCSQEALAREYSVTRTAIELIIRNINWKDEGYCPTVENCNGRRSEKMKKKISAAQSGENGYWARLTWSQVHEIREKYASGKYRYLDLSKEYGVTKNYIGAIIRNISWKE